MATRTWIGFTSGTFATTTNWLGGSVAVSGDDMIVDTALMTGAFYPTAMPVGAAVALNSLTINVTGAVDAPAIFSTGTNQNITIGVGGLNAVEAAADKPTASGHFIGDAAAPLMLAGCVGSVTTCAGKSGNSRFSHVSHQAGATLTLHGVDQSGIIKYRGNWAGKTIVAADSGTLLNGSFQAVTLAAGGELEYRATGGNAIKALVGITTIGANYIFTTYVPAVVTASTVGANYTFTAYAPAVFTATNVGAGTTFTAYAELGLYGGVLGMPNAIVINAHDVLSLVGGAYSDLTVNLFSQNPYTNIDATGTIVVTGGAANTDYPAAVDVRFGTTTGGLIGTLRVPAASDVRDGVLVDAGTGTLTTATFLL